MLKAADGPKQPAPVPPFRGIIPPLVTPFREDGTLDETVHRAEVRHMIAAGVHGLAVCGSTGEGHTLTTGETRRIAEITMEEAGSRLPVIVGIISDSTRQAVERAGAVADLGVAAVQVTPVHYLFRPDDDAMLHHFAAIASGSALPVIVYNVVPWSYLQPRLLLRILTEVEGVVGVKQSASDMRALAELLLLSEEAAMRNRTSILSAVDPLLYPSFRLGADGAIAAILTAVPEWCVALWDAVNAGDDCLALAIHKDLLRLWGTLDAPNLPANVRAAMRLRGRQGGLPRAPMSTSTVEQEQRIGAALAARCAALRPDSIPEGARL